MVGNIETLLLLLGMIGVLAVVAERLRFPFPSFVIAGLGIGLSPGLPEMGLDPQLVLMIFRRRCSTPRLGTSLGRICLT